MWRGRFTGVFRLQAECDAVRHGQAPLGGVGWRLRSALGRQPGVSPQHAGACSLECHAPAWLREPGWSVALPGEVGPDGNGREGCRYSPNPSWGLDMVRPHEASTDAQLMLLSLSEVWEQVDPLAADLDADPALAG